MSEIGCQPPAHRAYAPVGDQKSEVRDRLSEVSRLRKTTVRQGHLNLSPFSGHTEKLNLYIEKEVCS